MLICDNDGTLVDSEAAHFSSINVVVTDNGGSPVSRREWWEHCSGKGHARIWEWLKAREAAFKISREDFIAQCGRTYLKDLFNLRAKPGVLSAVRAFNKATGVITPVVSNTQSSVVQRGLSATGLARALGRVYGADYFEAHHIPKKPAPDSWLHVAALHGVPKDQMHRVVVFEDSEDGCKSARLAGAYVVQIGHHPNLNHTAPKSRYADYYIGPDPAELADFTRKALAGKVLKRPAP